MIKVIDKAIADKLISLGYQYMYEKINDKTIYVFKETDDLIKYMYSNYSKKNFFLENKLRF